jgi:hypothetical protein
MQEIGDWFEHVRRVGFSGSLNEHPAILDQASSRNAMDAMWMAITMQRATSIQKRPVLVYFQNHFDEISPLRSARISAGWKQD